MKYLVFRCEDHAWEASEVRPLLEGAKLAFLNELAQAGAAGTIKAKGTAVQERLHFFRGLLGLASSDAGIGRWYAAAAGISVEPGERIWCCDLVTAEGERILDAAAGKISTQESQVLIQALDEALGSEVRRWEVGSGSQHMLVIKDRALDLDVASSIPSPEALLGQVWPRALPKGQVGEALALLVTQAAKVLEQHPINSVRMDLEENPANLIWLWGAAAATDTPTFRQRTQLRGAIVSSHFALRGAARLYGMGYAEGPLDWSEAGIQALRQAVAHLVNHHDVVYVHLPIEAKEVIDRACAMDRLDQHLLKPLVEGWKPGEAWRLLWVSDNRMTEAIPFVAYGQGLPQQPIAQVAAEQFLQSPLRLNSADALWHWLVKE